MLAIVTYYSSHTEIFRSPYALLKVYRVRKFTGKI